MEIKNVTDLKAGDNEVFSKTVSGPDVYLPAGSEGDLACNKRTYGDWIWGFRIQNSCFLGGGIYGQVKYLIEQCGCWN